MTLLNFVTFLLGLELNEIINIIYTIVKAINQLGGAGECLKKYQKEKA